jgi:hypothetical protein
MADNAAERLRNLIDERRQDPRCDVELWRLMDHQSRTLRNLSNDDLAERWRGIAKNILYLIGPSRDLDGLEANGFSSWWWLQKLIHTEFELERRSLPNPDVPNVPSPCALPSDFHFDRASAPSHWARIGEAVHLLRTLHDGEIRFRPASSYDDPLLDAARRDRELEKIRKRPGQITTFTLPNGRTSNPIGDVSYSKRSATEANGELRDREYWLSSWSLEFDPRLFAEFNIARQTQCDALIVVWDIEKLGERIDVAAAQQFSGWLFADIPIRYFDPQDLLPSPALTASMEKDFSYGCQRELRLALGSPDPIEKGEPIFLKIGSLADIAGLYSIDGQKLGGVGPPSWR